MGKRNLFIPSPLILLKLHPQNPELTHHLPHFCLLKILFFHLPRYETQWLNEKEGSFGSQTNITTTSPYGPPQP